MSETTPVVGHDEVAALKLLALSGGLAGEVKVSCSELAEQLDASTQTASRRLQRLEEAGLVERDMVSDGQWVRVTDDGEFALRREYEDYRRVFETPGTVDLQGSVTGGMGEGRHYISLPGYMEQFRDRLGYEPFEGTLNLDLTPDSVRRRSALESIEPVPIDGWEDDERTYGPAVCYPASVERIEDARSDEGDSAGDAGDTDAGNVYDRAHVIAPERTHHDEDQLELIAPVKLRERLGLEDGDHLLIHVRDE